MSDPPPTERQRFFDNDARRRSFVHAAEEVGVKPGDIARRH